MPQKRGKTEKAGAAIERLYAEEIARRVEAAVEETRTRVTREQAARTESEKKVALRLVPIIRKSRGDKMRNCALGSELRLARAAIEAAKVALITVK